MARYRIGETPETGADILTQEIFVGVAVFGLLISIGFIIAGLRGRQYWLVFWGGGLSVCSIAYLLYVAFG